MTYMPPVAEQLFLLAHVVGADALGEAAEPDLVRAIVEGVGAFAAGEMAPLAARGDHEGARLGQGGVTMPDGYRKAYRAYVEGGWNTLAGPPEHGGQGLPFTLATVALEDMGSADMAFSLCMMLSAGAVEALKHHGTPEQKAVWLPKLISGEWAGTMNLTEPQAGSDVGALACRAEPAGDGGYRIKGQKIFITYGDHDLTDNIVHLVLARLPDAPAGTRGISLFLVPKYRLDAAGRPGAFNDARCMSIEHKLGIHASPTCVMSYGEADDCHGWLIGEPHGGMKAMFTMMNNARLNVGLQGVSIAEAATQKAAAYARERVQSARAGSADRAPVAIVEHPDVRRMLMRMTALTQGARALAYAAAGHADRAARGDAAAQARVDLLTPLVKAYGTDVGVEVASLGVQVHGGMGYIEETGAARFYRDARIAPIYEGTNGIQAADLVGRKLGQDGGGAFAALVAEMREDAQGETGLDRLIDACEAAGARLSVASVDDRLAASYPFLDMLAVAAAGALMARQHRAATAGEGDGIFLARKRAATRYYLDAIVPEAMGKAAAVEAGAELLYSLPAEAF